MPPSASVFMVSGCSSIVPRELSSILSILSVTFPGTFLAVWMVVIMVIMVVDTITMVVDIIMDTTRTQNHAPEEVLEPALGCAQMNLHHSRSS